MLHFGNSISCGPIYKLWQADGVNFIVAILAHKPITTFTPLYLITGITRVA
jgi:hypothetical protein